MSQPSRRSPPSPLLGARVRTWLSWLLVGGLLSLLIIAASPRLQHKLVSLGYRVWRHYLHPPAGTGNERTPALAGYKVRGVDVSAYQGEVDWRRVAREPGVKFAFIKATEGRSWVDPYFDENWDGARAAKLATGAYHYFRPKRDARQQADLFVGQVKLGPGDLPPVLDVERVDGRSPDELRRGVRTWLKLVGRRYGVKPILYTNHDFYVQYLHGHFDDYPLWLAHYEVRYPRLDRKRWIIWQHSDEMLLPGIHGYVDGNVFAGSVAEFQKLLLK